MRKATDIFKKADYIENIGIVSMLLAYPLRLDIVATIAGYSTSIKHILFPVMLVVVLMGIVVWAWKSLSLAVRVP